MNIFEIRQQLKTQSIYDIPLRVTFYARVSTEKDVQINSLENQILYFKNFISQHPNWKYVDGYIDEGITGMSTKKRENFQNMIEDAQDGKFDLIITKEISRFARNTLDSLQYTRDLLGYGVAVFFQSDNINTIDEDGELRLTIMSSLAQDEVRRLSSRVKFGHAQSIQNGVVLGNSRIFGYRKVNKKLVIEPEEAEMVRLIFELYATNTYSMKQIEQVLWDKGYRNHNGKKICHSTLSNTISNPKYKGYYCGRKVQIVNMFTKEQKFLPPEEWVMWKDESGDTVPAIVDEDLWDRANQILSLRSKDVKNRQNQVNRENLLSGKLICTDCGRLYHRKAIKTSHGVNSNWICAGKKENGAASCKSFTIYESDITPILLDAFTQSKPDIEKAIETYIALYKETFSSENVEVKIRSLKSNIDLINKKKSKLLGYNVNGQISDADFLKMNKDCDTEIQTTNEQIEELEQKAAQLSNSKNSIEEMRKTLRDATRDAQSGIINRTFIQKYIDKIYVTPVNESVMQLRIVLSTNSEIISEIRKHNKPPGHTFLIMCPERTMNFQRINRHKLNHEHNVMYRYAIVV